MAYFVTSQQAHQKTFLTKPKAINFKGGYNKIDLSIVFDINPVPKRLSIPAYKRRKSYIKILRARYKKLYGRNIILIKETK